MTPRWSVLLLGLTAVTFTPQSRRAVSHLRRGASGSPSAQHRLDAETQGRTPAPSTEVQGSEATVAPQAAEKRKGGFPATPLTCSISAELDGTPPPHRYGRIQGGWGLWERYLSLSTWFRISSTSWNARDRGERNTSTARRFLCQGDTEDFTNICWM